LFFEVLGMESRTKHKLSEVLSLLHCLSALLILEQDLAHFTQAGLELMILLLPSLE
jgi:hypothetical protein